MGRCCTHCGFEGLTPDSVDCPMCGNAADANADSPVLWNQDQLVSDLRDAFTGLGAGEGLASSAFASPLSNAVRLHSSVAIGGRLGDYEILNEIGRGGMGIVYRARQPALGRHVAVKVLRGAAKHPDRAQQRFHLEARAVARLNHPNIVPLFEHGESDGNLYFAMALIDGCSLDVALETRPELLSSSASRSGPAHDSSRVTLRSESLTTATSTRAEPPVDQTAIFRNRTLEDYKLLARLVADVADGLAHAHAQGVIHRDIKPQNILITDESRVYITDFGLSQLGNEPHLTLSGEVLGTPSYLSPEQICDSRVDHRTDIYSLGVTLYELLTGRRPFVGESRDQILHRVCTAEPVPPRRIDRRIPREIETICLKAIEKNPATRYQSAAVLAEDLRRFLRNEPLQARRRGPVLRATMFARRRRGVVIGSGLLILVIALAAGWMASIVAGKRTEAGRLLQAAYDQLVYLDYRTPQLVLPQIEQAEDLGADPVQLNIVRAIVDLGTANHVSAKERLEAILAARPDHRTAMYLLAWTHWRLNDRANSRAAFDRAEAGGGPGSADEWFLRGLSAHFDRPELAVESYETANAVRAADRQFFPQAVLHLARAYNQQMYALRTLEPAVDAKAILQQLVDQQHYGAYPHYLLSLTQRLAGEISEANDDAVAAENLYRDALNWARKGQERDPGDDRPITAEAECLERLGQYAEAAEARTRAIAAAAQEPTRCEGHHYRWRLHYWLNQFDAALDDIQFHAACQPSSIFYAHVYPSWVYAETGDMPRALEQARAIATANPTDPQAVLWSAACLRLLGQPQEAAQLLGDRREQVVFSTGLTPPQTEGWASALYDYAYAGLGLDELMAQAQNVADGRKLRAEAYFHAAIMALAAGERAQAVTLLEEAHQCFDSELRYTFHAKTLLTKLRLDPAWPPWLSQ